MRCEIIFERFPPPVNPTGSASAGCEGWCHGPGRGASGGLMAGARLRGRSRGFEELKDGVAVGSEDASRPRVAIGAVGIHDAGVDGRALDDGPFGREVATGEGDGAGQAALAGRVGREDDAVGLDAVGLDEAVAEPLAAVGLGRCAAWATAGRWSSQLVLPPKAAWAAIAL